MVPGICSGAKRLPRNKRPLRQVALQRTIPLADFRLCRRARFFLSTRFFFEDSRFFLRMRRRNDLL